MLQAWPIWIIKFYRKYLTYFQNNNYYQQQNYSLFILLLSCFQYRHYFLKTQHKTQISRVIKMISQFICATRLFTTPSWQTTLTTTKKSFPISPPPSSGFTTPPPRIDDLCHLFRGRLHPGRIPSFHIRRKSGISHLSDKPKVEGVLPWTKPPYCCCCCWKYLR